MCDGNNRCTRNNVFSEISLQSIKALWDLPVDSYLRKYPRLPTVYYPRYYPRSFRTTFANAIMVDKEVGENAFSFDELVNIFSYLPPEGLSKCSQVCRHWHEASQVGSLWKRHCLQRWNFCHLGKLKPGENMGMTCSLSFTNARPLKCAPGGAWVGLDKSCRHNF